MNAENLEGISDEEIAFHVAINQGIFVHIINRYERRLRSFIMRISNISYEDADDILQDIFIKVYININEFDTSLKFSSWIYRIARNEAISAYRKRSVRPAVLPDADDISIEAIVSDLDMEHSVDIIHLKEKISQALEEMDEKYRDIIVLKFFEDKDYKEISDIMKKPIGTVATHINRAKHILKQKLVDQINNDT